MLGERITFRQYLWSLRNGLILAVCLGLFAYFGRDHHFTKTTWIALVVLHVPWLLLLAWVEAKRQKSVNSAVAFLVVWGGGMLLGLTIFFMMAALHPYPGKHPAAVAPMTNPTPVPHATPSP
jgi:phage shock protein PspC (stress-responsive transcriptional regulator)